MQKEEIITNLKRLAKEINEQIDLASELKLIVKVKQEFHPASNAHTNPLNSGIQILVTETINY